jgi:hypothetical protein
MPDTAKLLGLGVIKHDDRISRINPRYKGFLLNLKIPSVLRDWIEPSGKPNIKSWSSFFIAMIAITMPEKNGTIASNLSHAGGEYHASSGHKIPAGIKEQEKNAHNLAVMNATGWIGGVANMLIPCMIILIIKRTRTIENAINPISIMSLSMS